MKLTSFAALFSLSAVMQCAVSEYCGTHDPPSKLVAAHRMLKEQEKTTATRMMARDQAAQLDIELYMHVVETEEKKGQIKEDKVQQQVQVILDTFKKYNIFFHYKGVDFTVNDDWATSVNNTLARGQALRKGDYLALNIYITTGLESGGLLGICTFPHNADKVPGVADEPTDDEIMDDASQYIPKDGCTIAAPTLPGGFFEYPTEGLTAVHEIGHWLGLFHTFQGDSCSGPGDLIADTRPQSNQSSGCPAHRISCPDVPFAPTPEDPFHNYMDYSSDACYNQFTPLQIVRVFGVWPLFRIANDNPNNITDAFNGTLPGASNSSISGGNGTIVTPSGNYSLPLINPTKTALPSNLAGMGILPQTSAAAAAAGTSSPNGGGIPAQPSSVAAAGAQTTIAPPAGGSVQQSSNAVPNNSGAGGGGGGSGGIVTMGCPNNGNSFPTGTMGSCVTGVITITTISCS